jgi:hypothetical protein
MDGPTCQNCANLDGEEFIVGSPEYEDALPPYVNCDGRDSCRCVMLYIGAGSDLE